MKNWAVLIASIAVMASSLNLPAQQVDAGGGDFGGDPGAVDGGGVVDPNAGGAGFGGAGGGGQQGGRGGRGGRGGGQQGQGGQFQGGQGGQGGQQGRGGRTQQQPGQGGQQGTGRTQGGVQGGTQTFGQGQSPFGGAQIPGMGLSSVNPRTLQNIQVQLSSPDPEWEALGPKVQELLELQALIPNPSRTMMYSSFGGQGGRGGRGGGGFGGFGGTPDPATNPVAAALAELQAAIDDANSSDTLLREKLNNYRTARDKARAAVAKKQEEVRALLTLRQEAIAIMQLNLIDKNEQ